MTAVAEDRTGALTLLLVPLHGEWAVGRLGAVCTPAGAGGRMVLLLASTVDGLHTTATLARTMLLYGHLHITLILELGGTRVGQAGSNHLQV